jgi:succinate dehydrogenase hydrophobic anchor subunit
MRTPAHVVPEWYFLPYYAILRSIPHKTGGILAMLGSLLVLFLIPFINTSETKNTFNRPIFKIFFWIFISDILVLTWVGQKPVRDAYILTGQIATIYYFFFFLIIIFAAGVAEKSLVGPLQIYNFDKAGTSALEEDLLVEKTSIYSAPIYLFYYKYIKYNPSAFFVIWFSAQFLMLFYGIYYHYLTDLIVSQYSDLNTLQEIARELENKRVSLKKLEHLQHVEMDRLCERLKEPSFMEMERYKHYHRR